MKIHNSLRHFAFIPVLAILLFLNSDLNAAGDAGRKELAQTQRQEDMEFGKAYGESRFLPGEMLFYCDLYEGYDNNVNLDSSREKDIFTEADMELGYSQPVALDLNATLDYYLNSVTYHNITDASFYANNFSLDLDSDIFDGMANVAFNNRIVYNYFPREELSTYIAYDPQICIKHNFNESLFQRVVYDLGIRGYIDSKAADGANERRDTDRMDISNSVSYELGGLFLGGFFVKIKNQYIKNDSNDQFMDYYDYWAYRAAVTAMIPILTQRLHGLLSAGYQRTNYDSRQLVDDDTRKERDNLYNISSSLVFDMTKNISVSVNYAYRQNGSNEPSQKYSGSTISAGLHYAF